MEIKPHRPITPLVGMIVRPNRNDRFSALYVGATESGYEHTAPGTFFSAAEASTAAWKIPDFLGHVWNSEAFIVSATAADLDLLQPTEALPDLLRDGFEILRMTRETALAFLA